MAQRYNVSLDSPSPLLSYSPADLWRPMKPADDGLSSSYANGSTAAVTGFAGIGAKMTFTFHGTSVWIFGAKRDNHGFYNVTLDSNPMQTFNGLEVPNAFQQLLYSATNLSNTRHVVTVVNVGPFTSNNSNLIWFDVDWVTYEQVFKPPSSSNSSNPSMIVTTYTVDNNISYTPSISDWPSSSFIGSNGSTVLTRTTQLDTASATLNFTLPSSAGAGAVGIFGSMDEVHGNYIVSLSETSPNASVIVQNQGYSALYDFDIIHEQMLFYQDGLTPGGSYSLKVTNAPSGATTDYFGLDYIKTWSVGAGTTVGESPPSSSTHKSSGSSSHTGVIVGAVVAGISGLAIFATLVVFLVRRRRSRHRVTPADLGVNDRTGSRKAASSFVIDGGMPHHSLPGLGTTNYGATNDGANNGWVPPPLGVVHYGESPSHLSSGDVMTTTGTPYQYLVYTGYEQQPAFPPSTISPSTRSGVTATASASASGSGSGSGSNNGSGYPPYAQVLTTPATTSPASPPPPQQQNAEGAFPRDTRIKHTYQRSNNSASSPASQRPVPPPPTPAAPLPESQSQQPHPSFLVNPHSESPSRDLPPIPTPQAPTPTRSPHGALHPTTSTEAISQIRFERDAGPLESSTPVEEVLILPPEYEDARQPWERHRDDF